MIGYIGISTQTTLVFLPLNEFFLCYGLEFVEEKEINNITF